MVPDLGAILAFAQHLRVEPLAPERASRAPWRASCVERIAVRRHQPREGDVEDITQWLGRLHDDATDTIVTVRRRRRHCATLLVAVDESQPYFLVKRS